MYKWANKCGIGFELPEIGTVRLPARSLSKASLPVAAAPEISKALQLQPKYIAEDNDLDRFFYAAPEEAA
jgi:hypothetical protein